MVSSIIIESFHSFAQFKELFSRKIWISLFFTFEIELQTTKHRLREWNKKNVWTNKCFWFVFNLCTIPCIHTLFRYADSRYFLVSWFFMSNIQKKREQIENSAEIEILLLICRIKISSNHFQALRDIMVQTSDCTSISFLFSLHCEQEK